MRYRRVTLLSVAIVGGAAAFYVGMENMALVGYPP